jgi:hypothetical protein
MQGRNVNEATRSIPIIGDGDTGYGNAMNVKRTVRGYAQAGFAGVRTACRVADICLAANALSRRLDVTTSWHTYI